MMATVEQWAEVQKNIYIVVDFDGTICEHRFPDIGRAVPDALRWLIHWQAKGAKIILFTTRSDDCSDGPVLTQAVEWLKKRDLALYGINENPDDRVWTNSPKPYGHIYIDDAAVGCPLRPSAQMGQRMMVDWRKVGPMVESTLFREREGPDHE